MSDNFFHHLASECIKLSKVTDIKISDTDNTDPRSKLYPITCIQ